MDYVLIQQLYNAEDPNTRIRLVNRFLAEQSSIARIAEERTAKVRDSLLGLAKLYSNMWHQDYETLIKASQQALKTGVDIVSHWNIPDPYMEKRQSILHITQRNSTPILEPNDSQNGTGLK